MILLGQWLSVAEVFHQDVIEVVAMTHVSAWDRPVTMEHTALGSGWTCNCGAYTPGAQCRPVTREHTVPGSEQNSSHGAYSPRVRADQ